MPGLSSCLLTNRAFLCCLQICNLPDHPIHAGCTAVVAVLLGRTLTVANAGDSRGVLCRAGGTAEPLSFDHKPQQPREMNRINNAGGFVNRFGRVNGNLNLSRSIGDLKYKQVPGIAPADQMITAQPDILQYVKFSERSSCHTATGPNPSPFLSLQGYFGSKG